VEDLNPSDQTGEQPEVVFGMETMLADSVPESSGAWRFAEESTTATDGVEDGERLATMVVESMVTLGATARATGSLEAEARAADAMPESGAERPAILEEQGAWSDALCGHEAPSFVEKHMKMRVLISNTS